MSTVRLTAEEAFPMPPSTSHDLCIETNISVVFHRLLSRCRHLLCCRCAGGWPGCAAAAVPYGEQHICCRC